MIGNLYKMNNHVLPESNLRPGLVDKRVILYNLLVLHVIKKQILPYPFKTLYYIFIKSLESTEGYIDGGCI